MWPFAADQPQTSAMVTLKHGAAFELLAVREGDGAQPPLRVVLAGDEPVDFTAEGVRKEVRVLYERMRGEEGAQVRRNAEQLGATMKASWEDGGEASSQLEGFLRKYVDAK
jgi:hypothetical protein